MALEKIILEYKAEVSELRKDLDGIKKQLSDLADKSKESGKQTESALNDIGTIVKGKLSDAFMSLGKVIAGVFAVERIGRFINSSIELATRTQEVKSAFDKLNNPALLNNLIDAMEGTLSNLKLMGIALKASNLQVPLEKLATILKFAKQRADELGGSTEDLANTIIQGIGVKSTRALVQVGISQDQFSQEVKKTGDYFEALDNIMTDTLKKAGEGFESTADKQDKLRASIENTQAQIGDGLLPVIDDLLTGINNAIIGFNRLFNITGSAEAEGFKTIMDMFADGSVPAEGFAEAIKETEKQLEDAQKRAKNLGGSFFGKLLDPAAIRNARNQVGLLTGQLKALQALQEGQNKATTDTSGALDVNTTALTNNEDALEKNAKAAAAWLKKEHEMTKAVNEAFVAILNDMGIELERATGRTDAHGHSLHNVAVAADEVTYSVNGMTDAFKTEEEKLNDAADAINLWGGSFLTVLDGINNYYQKSSDYRLSILQNELEQGLISQEQYDKEVKKAKRKQAEDDKKFTLFQIAIDTAAAIVQALAEGNAARAVSAAIVGAAQAVIVNETPIPAFKEGVVGFKGKGTETSDENIVRISRNESVITAKGTRKHKPILEAINKDRLDDYLINFYLPKLIKQKAGAGTFQAFEDRYIVRAIQEETQATRETNKILKGMKSNQNVRRDW